MSKEDDRLWEIDFTRGIAILMMITYHAVFNLYYFSEYGIDVHRLGWRILGRSTAVLFITLVGISLTLSYSRAKKEKSGKELPLKYLLRGAKIFSWGIIISVITYIFIGEEFIIFGILHFIGTAIIISYPVVRYRYIPLIFGIISIIIGLYISEMYVTFQWLLWIGLRPYGFTTVDYFPIFPWIGVLLLGIFLGHTLYPEGKRKFDSPDLSNLLVIRKFCFLGRNSLKIYLIHQPILLISLYMLGIIEVPFL
ncbi:MAG: heparan-alpha-glucosaminide N-acetyltransferase [Candidatus Thermoplasmatota archaeon]